MKYKVNMVFALTALIIYCCMRISYIFINVYTFFYFAEILLALMLINAVFTIFNAVTKKGGKAGFYISFAFMLLSNIINIAIYIMAMDDYEYYISEFFALLPYLAILAFVIFILFFYPSKKLKKNTVISFAMVAAVIALMINNVYSFVPFSFRSEPVVFEAGNNYTIVWTTTSNATGWIEYPDKITGETKQIYETESGNIIADKIIHKISVDKDILDNNTYTAKSTRCIMHLSNNAVMGKTIETNAVFFNGDDGDNETSFLVLSDSHGFSSVVEKTAMYAKPYDFLVLMGDMASQLSSEKEIIDNILKMPGNITGGSVPVIFVRGNHETRGRFTNTLKEYIGLPNDSFYYTFTYGPIGAVVLDTGEDKLDGHVEYSGLANYEAYKAEQKVWLENVSSSDFLDSFQYKLLFAHIPFAELEEEDYISNWVPTLNNMPFAAQLAGHKHTAKLLGADTEHGFPIALCGGRSGSFGTKFIAVQVSLSPGKIVLESFNQDGENNFNETINL